MMAYQTLMPPKRHPGAYEEGRLRTPMCFMPCGGGGLGIDPRDLRCGLMLA